MLGPFHVIHAFPMPDICTPSRAHTRLQFILSCSCSLSHNHFSNFSRHFLFTVLLTAPYLDPSSLLLTGMHITSGFCFTFTFTNFTILSNSQSIFCSPISKRSLPPPSIITSSSGSNSDRFSTVLFLISLMVTPGILSSIILYYLERMCTSFPTPLKRLVPNSHSRLFNVPLSFICSWSLRTTFR